MEQQAVSNPHGDSDVITLIGTMTIKAEHEAEFVDFATGIARAVHERKPGTILYVLHEHPAEPHTYVRVERCRDPEALSAHQQAPYIAEAMSRLPNWLSKAPELTQLKQIAPR